MTTAITNLGAEAFMNYLDELQNKYIERVNQEFVAYFETEPVAILSRRHFRRIYESSEKLAAAWSELRSAVELLPPHRFSDGVMVDMTRYLLSQTKACEMVTAKNTGFHITLQRARKRADKLLLIRLDDTRVRPEYWSFRELVSVPPAFYDFLRRSVCVDDTWMRYSYFSDRVRSQLTRHGDALCGFDRLAKLRALRKVLAS